MAPPYFPIRKVRSASTRWFRLRPFVRRGGYSDPTLFGPAFVCECVFVAGAFYNPPCLSPVPPGFSTLTCTVWEGHTHAHVGASYQEQANGLVDALAL